MSIAGSAGDQRRPAPGENPSNFKTEYHPRSKRPTLLQTADEFRIYKTSSPPPDPAPWRPFRCEGDFEFTEIVLDTSLNKRHIDALLDLISRVAQGQTQVTFKNEDELRKVCDVATEELTPVSGYDLHFYSSISDF